LIERFNQIIISLRLTEDLQRWSSFAVTDAVTLLRRAKLMLMPPSAVNVIQLVGMFDVYIMLY